MGDYIVISGERHEISEWNRLDGQEGELCLEVWAVEAATEGN